MEEWRDIKGYDGIYQVSSYGRVRSLDRVQTYYSTRWNTTIERKLKGRIRERVIDSSGYPFIMIDNKNYRIHQLVAREFIPNPNNYGYVNHKDEDKTNNHVSNLEWCTFRQNLDYGTRCARSGKGHWKAVNQYTIEGVFIRRHDSITSAAASIGKSEASITACAHGRNHTAHGYVWRFD